MHSACMLGLSIMRGCDGTMNPRSASVVQCKAGVDVHALNPVEHLSFVQDMRGFSKKNP